MGVGPQHRPADAVDGVEQMVVVVPVDRDENEAQKVDRELRAERPEIGQSVSGGWSQVEHHDRDHDSDHAIAERLKAAAAHAPPHTVVGASALRLASMTRSVWL